jgi:hypothetical protein
MFSGMPLKQPVVCLKSGLVFEQAVAFRYVEMTGKCPISGIDIEIKDFVPVQPTCREKNQESDAEKVAFVFELMRDKWIEVILENFKLKMQNFEFKEQIALAKSQLQAALIGIARTLGENQGFSRSLKDLKKL